MRAQNIAPLQVGESTHRPASPYTAVRQAIGAVFFRRSRLFLREAAFFSGGEGCEWGARAPPWARVVIKLKTCFQALSHSLAHDRALALTSSPPDFLFSSIHHPPLHPTKPPIPPIPPIHHSCSRASPASCCKTKIGCANLRHSLWKNLLKSGYE